MAVFAATAAPALASGSLLELARAYVGSPSPARRAPLARFAAAHPRDADGALARLALGITDYGLRNFASAIANLRGLSSRLPGLADYAAYYLAAARVETGDTSVGAADLAPVRTPAFPSPLGGQAWLLEGCARMAAGAAADAVRVLREHEALLPQPDGLMALAAAHEAAGNAARAAASYQQVYYKYPLSDQAEKAASALTVLRQRMGMDFPPATPAQLLERAARFSAARDFLHARAEYREIAPQLTGLERDLAMVRAGGADYLAGQTSAAAIYLRTLQVGGEPDAERLYYLVECARRLDDERGMLAALDQISQTYPQSPWRFKALLSVANRYLVSNQPDRFVPLYAAAAQAFPSEPQTPNCRWKVVWSSYLNRRSSAAAELREHLERFPRHPTATAAMYYLGRLAERDGDAGTARAFYTRLAGRYPNYYYGLLARDRLASLRKAPASAATLAFLNRIAAPPPERIEMAEPSRATTFRVERARLLRRAGLSDLAVAELRYGIRQGGQAVLLSREMARGAGSAYQSLRYVKSLQIDYLAMETAQAPAWLWEYLFPLPWRTDLLRNTRARKLDPYTVAGLIRQESEFNAEAVSRARAFGLTQVMPGTGRQLARKLGLRRFNNRMLLDPGTNLKLGTYYIRTLLDKLDGSWEQTLAAYNAGPNRVAEWAGWYRYQEPAEFVETIPYTETREYVQAVLRNAALYRRLYGTRRAGFSPPGA